MSKPIVLVRLNVRYMDAAWIDDYMHNAMAQLKRELDEDYYVIGIPERFVGENKDRNLLIEIHSVCDLVDEKTVEELQEYIKEKLKVIENE